MIIHYQLSVTQHNNIKKTLRNMRDYVHIHDQKDSNKSRVIKKSFTTNFNIQNGSCNNFKTREVPLVPFNTSLF